MAIRGTVVVVVDDVVVVVGAGTVEAGIVGSASSELQAATNTRLLAAKKRIPRLFRVLIIAIRQ